MIFHFTKELETIKSIIKSCSFRLGYSTEYFSDKKQIISRAAHPMVCFSEYTESELVLQNITYGGYAVALTKDWAKSKGLNPVLYVNNNSQVAEGIASLLKARQSHGKDKIPKKLRLPIMQVRCFTKHESGYNSHLDCNNFSFKNENEWRYVPTIKQIANGRISLNQSIFLKNKKKYNDRLLQYPLEFSYSDIEAIYVKENKDVNELKKLFPSLNSKIKLKKWQEAEKYTIFTSPYDKSLTV